MHQGKAAVSSSPEVELKIVQFLVDLEEVSQFRRVSKKVRCHQQIGCSNPEFLEYYLMRKSSRPKQLPCDGNIGSAVSEPIMTVPSLFERYEMIKFRDRHENTTNAREQSRERTPITEPD